MKIKTMLLLPLVAVCGMAQATDLYRTPGFGALHQYHDVGNSDDSDLSIYIGVSGNASVYLDGDVYTGIYNGSGIPSIFTSLSGQLVLTLDEATRRVCVKSGRGQTCTTRWTLQTGTLTR